MTDIDIVGELRRLYEDSTTDGDRSWVHGDVVNERGCVLFSGRRCIEVGTIFTQEDADLIVAMHNHLPALLDVIEADRAIAQNNESYPMRRNPFERIDASWWEVQDRLVRTRDAALAALKRSDEG